MDFDIDQWWFHKLLLHSFIPGFLRGIHDPALSQFLPFFGTDFPGSTPILRFLLGRLSPAQMPSASSRHGS